MFEIYQDKAAEWRWRLKAHNGQIIADSAEGYVSKANVERAISTVLNVCHDARVKTV